MDFMTLAAAKSYTDKQIANLPGGPGTKYTAGDLI